MATQTLRRQIIQSPAAGMSDGGATTMRSAQNTNIYLGDYFLGGVENWSVSESNGGTFVNQIGNDYLEFRPGMRSFSFSFSRNQLRGKTLRDIMGEIYGTVADIDWRALPIDFRVHQIYQSASGNTTFEDTWQTVRTAFVTGYTESRGDGTALVSEAVSGIAKGVQNSGKGVKTFGPHSYLLGAAGDIANFGKVAQVVA